MNLRRMLLPAVVVPPLLIACASGSPENQGSTSSDLAIRPGGPGGGSGGGSAGIPLSCQLLSPAQRLDELWQTKEGQAICTPQMTDTFTIGGLVGSGFQVSVNYEADLASQAYVFNGDNGAEIPVSLRVPEATHTFAIDAQPTNPVQVCTANYQYHRVVPKPPSGATGPLVLADLPRRSPLYEPTGTYQFQGYSCGDPYYIGGTASGLFPSNQKPLVLALTQDDTRIETIQPSNGTFTFSSPIGPKFAQSNYYVSIVQQPWGQTCTITNGSGTIPPMAGGSSTPVNVSVTCVDLPCGQTSPGSICCSGSSAQTKCPNANSEPSTESTPAGNQCVCTACGTSGLVGCGVRHEQCASGLVATFTPGTAGTDFWPAVPGPCEACSDGFTVLGWDTESPKGDTIEVWYKADAIIPVGMEAFGSVPGETYSAEFDPMQEGAYDPTQPNELWISGLPAREGYTVKLYPGGLPPKGQCPVISKTVSLTVSPSGGTGGGGSTGQVCLYCQANINEGFCERPAKEWFCAPPGMSGAEADYDIVQQCQTDNAGTQSNNVECCCGSDEKHPQSCTTQFCAEAKVDPNPK